MPKLRRRILRPTRDPGRQQGHPRWAREPAESESNVRSMPLIWTNDLRSDPRKGSIWSSPASPVSTAQSIRIGTPGRPPTRRPGGTCSTPIRSGDSRSPATVTRWSRHHPGSAAAGRCVTRAGRSRCHRSGAHREAGCPTARAPKPCGGSSITVVRASPPRWPSSRHGRSSETVVAVIDPRFRCHRVLAVDYPRATSAAPQPESGNVRGRSMNFEYRFASDTKAAGQAPTTTSQEPTPACNSVRHALLCHSFGSCERPETTGKGTACARPGHSGKCWASRHGHRGRGSVDRPGR